MGDDRVTAFIETAASPDDPTAAVKDFLFDPFRFAQTAADAGFLETIDTFKEKATFRVVVTLERLFTFSPTAVMNDDDRLVIVVHPHDGASLQFPFDQERPPRGSRCPSSGPGRES